RRNALTTVCVWALPVVCAAQLNLEQRGTDLLLLQDGTAVSERPLRFVIQEWKRNDTASTADSTADEVNTVGSIVADVAVDTSGLLPNGDGWTDDPTREIEYIDNSYQEITIFPRDLKIDATWTVEPGVIKVSGWLINMVPDGDRADVPVTLSLVIPVGDEEQRWLVDQRRWDDAESREERLDTVATSAGARAAMSWLPFGAVQGKEHAIAAGLPLDQPRIQRIRWAGD